MSKGLTLCIMRIILRDLVRYKCRLPLTHYRCQMRDGMSNELF